MSALLRGEDEGSAGKDALSFPPDWEATCFLEDICVAPLWYLLPPLTQVEGGCAEGGCLGLAISSSRFLLCIFAWLYPCFLLSFVGACKLMLVNKRRNVNSYQLGLSQ